MTMKVSRQRIVTSYQDIFGHFLLSAIATTGVEIPNPDEYEVTLTMNGVELPIEEVFLAWHKKLKDSVESRAEELFNEKFQNARDEFLDITDRIHCELDNEKMKIAHKMNIDCQPIEYR